MLRSNAESERLRKKGVLFRYLSFGIGILGLMLLGWCEYSTEQAGVLAGSIVKNMLFGVAFFACFAFLFVVVVRLHQVSRSLLQKSVDESLAHDNRAPVLYL